MIKEKAAVTELVAFYVSTEKTKKTAVTGRDFYSLSYRYYGKVSIKSNHGEFVSGANSITFMPKNTPYETEIIEGTQIAVVHFKLDRDVNFCNPSIWEGGDKSMRALFEKLIQSFRVGEAIDFGCMAIFYDLLAKLESAELLKSREQIPQKIACAREKMFQSFSDPLFSITMLAECVDISTAYLRREFSRAYGKSPCAFLRDLRIANAKNLLQSENLSIAQIAKQSGFASASYFIQVFSKAVGESPEKYRRRFYTK